MFNVLSILLLGAGLAFQEGQKPVIDSPIKADYFKPIERLQQLIEASDLICLASIIQKTDASRGGRPMTLYRLRIVEVIQGHPRVTDAAVVARALGLVEYPEKIFRITDPEMPDWTPGQTFLFFLKWDEETNAFWTVQNARGVAWVDSAGKLRTYGRSKPLKVLEGLTPAQARASLIETR